MDSKNIMESQGSKLLIKGGRVLVNRKWEKVDLYIEQGLIKKIGKDLEAGPKVQVFDGRGKWISPGFVDVHVHLREPGFEHKETIETGTMAAAKGGYTTIFPMANIRPCPDTEEKMKAYMDLIKKKARVNVIPYSPITSGEQGATLVDMEAMIKLGVSHFSDDGVGVSDDNVMRAAMEQCSKLNKAENSLELSRKKPMIVAHTEDMKYREKGAALHQGEYTKKLGIKGIPSICETSQLQRDLKLALETKAPYHVCHLSAKESVAALKRAKEQGGDVSGEVTPHHLLLEDVQVKDTNWKMNPPLRSREDRLALIDGLKEGVIDFIATDHAPHTEEEKALDIEHAPFGIVGLETAFALLYTELVRKQEIFSVEELVALMSEKPAARFGLADRGVIKVGNQADLVILDLDKQWIINKEQFLSKGKNTPFEGMTVFGEVVATFVGGVKVYEE